MYLIFISSLCGSNSVTKQFVFGVADVFQVVNVWDREPNGGSGILLAVRVVLVLLTQFLAFCETWHINESVMR